MILAARQWGRLRRLIGGFMRALCCHLTATLLITSGSGFAFAEAPASKAQAGTIVSATASDPGRRADRLSIDSLLNDRDTKSDAAKAAPVAPPEKMTALAPADWAPEHRPASPDVQQPAAKPADSSPAPAAAATAVPVKAEDKAIDLGPDEAVKVPPPAPTHDPLDTPKPAAGNGAPGATSPAADTLSPEQQAIKAALDKKASAVIKGVNAGEMKKEREAVALFYKARDFKPAWSDNKQPIAAVDSIVSRLGHAGDDALTLASVPTGLKTDGSADEIADSDLALTEAVVSYAREATGSRVDPSTIGPLIGARPDLANPIDVLGTLIATGADAGSKLQALNPIEPRYVALRDKLMELRSEHSDTATELPIPDGPTLRVGMHDPRVPLIRSRFSLDAITDDTAQLEYDTQVADAVAGFQRANGLPPSGILTKRTVAALSGDAGGNKSTRIEDSLVANMEMWRWMPRDLGVDRVEVNVPDFTVSVIHDGQEVAKNKVVVGKPDTPTPIFSKAMKYVIVNPVWYVPQSIIKKEWGGSAPRGFDVSYSHGQMIVKQPPGAKNALGRIKFIFPNDYAVYLHDTQAKGLFAASKRAYSHGCVRVDKPFDFAEAVMSTGLANDAHVTWSKKRLMSLLGDKERYINLPQPLPIHIEYFTATVDPATDHLVIKDDVYDYAHKVAAILARQG